MDTRTLLTIASIAGLILFSRHRARRRFNRSVDATITKTQGEAGSISSWWSVTAEWTDPQSGQPYHFRSPHLHSSPKHRVGEQVAVSFNATKPKYYHMEL